MGTKFEVNTLRLEEAVAKARDSFEFEAGPAVWDRIWRMIKPLTDAARISGAAHTNPMVRDALYQMALAEEWRIKLESLIESLGLRDNFMGLAFPKVEVQDALRVPMIIESEASKYALSARVIFFYILAHDELPEFCRRDFGEKVEKKRKGKKLVRK